MVTILHIYHPASYRLWSVQIILIFFLSTNISLLDRSLLYKVQFSIIEITKAVSVKSPYLEV